MQLRLATNSLTGNWKPGGVTPSAPLAFMRSKKLIIGSYLTPPLDFRKPRKVGIVLISRKYQKMHIRIVHPKV